jgi:hypothetical protein
MTQSQIRQIYQQVNTAYNKMAEVREEDVPGLKEAKQYVLGVLVELNSQLDGDWK